MANVETSKGGITKANGGTAPHKPAPTETHAIDLTVDLSTLKVPALTDRLVALEAALASYDAIAKAAQACNREIAGRLHEHGIGKHVVAGEDRRVRGVNGSSPPAYQLYALNAKKEKAGPAVDIATL